MTGRSKIAIERDNMAKSELTCFKQSRDFFRMKGDKQLGLAMGNKEKNDPSPCSEVSERVWSRAKVSGRDLKQLLKNSRTIHNGNFKKIGLD